MQTNRATINSAAINNVVLIHGIARSRFCMNNIGRDLKKAGYTTHNMRFHHWVKSIDAIAERVYQQLQTVPQPFHIVCHSMGGIVVRALLKKYPDLETGIIIMLGTPNHGSELVNYVESRAIIGRIFRTVYSHTGKQLSANSAYLKTLPDLAERNITIIAGNSGLSTLTKHALPQPSDGTVSVDSTKLANHTHVVMPVGHMWMLYDKSVRFRILEVLTG